MERSATVGSEHTAPDQKDGHKRERHRKGRRIEKESSSGESDSVDERRTKRQKRRKKGSSSSDDDDVSSDDDTSSEEDGHRSRQKHSSRRRKRRHMSLSTPDSEESESDRKRRKHRKHRRSKKKEDSDSDDTDKESGKRKRRKEKERHGGKRKLASEALKKKARKEKRKKKKEKLGSGAVTDRYGKYGVIREVDMWNKRPEFGAWLSEVKHINIETLPNREEREMFKDYMEDYNTATLPSKKYYNMELHHRNKVAKAHAKGQQLVQAEKVVFDDEEEKRNELQRQRDQKKEADYQAYKASMAAGLAQDMRDQDRLRNEMQYQYRLGNMEAVDTIKRRLAPEDPSTVP